MYIILAGYENLEVIKELDKIVDVYLPDFKYASNVLAKKYSGVDKYVQNVEKCLIEMKRQVGNNIFDENGMIKRGLIVRHLILPNNIINSKLVLKWIADNLGKDTYISIMSQYFPTYLSKNDDLLNRKITEFERDCIYDYIQKLGFTNGYIQQLGENEENYVPEF